MRIIFVKWIIIIALVLASAGLFGCATLQPMVESEDTVELFLTPDDFQILGGSRGRTERFKILFFGFGPRNSFLKAERMACEEKGADILVSRVRIKSFEGLMIPAFWLSWFGVEDAQDFPLIGYESFITAGVAVNINTWHTSD